LKLFAPLKPFGPYKPIGVKSYRAKSGSRLDHGQITAEVENGPPRSDTDLTRMRNSGPGRVAVTQITAIL
jgi:hypothetical protein